MLNERLCNEGLPINFDCLAFFRHVSIAQRTSVIVFHPLWKILPLWPGLKPTTLCKAEASGIQYDSVGNQIVSLTRFCPTRLSVFRQNGWLRLEILLHCIFCSYILKWTSRVTVIFFCDLWHADKRHSVLYFEAKQLLWFAVLCDKYFSVHSEVVYPWSHGSTCKCSFRKKWIVSKPLLEANARGSDVIAPIIVA